MLHFKVIFALLCTAVLASATPLDDYVSKPDPAYKWVDTGQTIVPNASQTTAYVLNVTSQTWLNPSKVVGPHNTNIWSHQVAVIRPKTITSNKLAVAVMTGGCNENPGPVPDDDEYLDVAAQIAQRTGTVAIVIYQIPNCHMVFPSDPSQKKRSEDALIAWAWKEYLDDPAHDPEWLPRLPMVKGGMACMKAAQEFLAQKQWADIAAGGWVVAGASKRGWTTWMVGAATCPTCVTIKALIPMVPIVGGSMLEEVKQQYQSYGGFTFAFRDYLDAGVLRRLDEPGVIEMLSIVEPASAAYTTQLQRLPKLAVLSSDDEFMQFDWSAFWPWDQFGGSKKNMHLMIAPNSEHGLSTGIPEILASISAFISSVAAEEAERPSFNVTKDATTGEITVTTDPAFPPSKVVFRHAETLQGELRDFRWVRLDDNTTATKRCTKPGKLIPPGEGGGNCLQPIVWYPKRLRAEKGTPTVFKAKPPAPTVQGRYVGYYVELYFPSKTLKYDHMQFTTPGYVWPDTLPFPKCGNFSTCAIKLV